MSVHDVDDLATDRRTSMSLLTPTLGNAWFCQASTDTHHIGGWRQRRPSRAYLDCSKLHRATPAHGQRVGFGTTKSACKARAEKKPVSKGKDWLPSNDKGSSSPKIAGRSYQGLLSIITQYPITFACGSLVLVFIVPKATAFGLVGVERALLSFLLELEQLLVAALLTGAKWVILVGAIVGTVVLVWYESWKKKS